ncbi:sugar kinase [Bacillus sp. Marseille-P3800]|uniref:sugar kinase n=1 Tax=Bacillus sp. Marseille-P3800 TaxID=2014782 RepID=UPI000C06EB33|nr:sugar kinase [Bacillus sp. Marseille-P3800]
MDVLSMGETMVLFSPRSSGQLRYETDFQAKVAGAETNTLIGLAKLGYKSSWISRVGDDEFGRKIIHAVRGEGIGTESVTIDDRYSTGLFFKEKTTEALTSVQYYRHQSAASFLSVNDVEPVDVSRFQYVYLTGITPALSETCADAVHALMRKAIAASVPVVFDPNIRKKLLHGEIGKQLMKDCMAASTIALPGRQEGDYLFGTTNEKQIAEACMELGADTVVVKLGEDGAYFQTKIESGYVPAFSVRRVVDPVGAGDGFAAGLLAGLLEKKSIEESVKQGCAIGAIVTQVNGDIEGLPTRNQLTTFMEADSADDVAR